MCKLVFTKDKASFNLLPHVWSEQHRWWKYQRESSRGLIESSVTLTSSARVQIGLTAPSSLNTVLRIHRHVCLPQVFNPSHGGMSARLLRYKQETEANQRQVELCGQDGKRFDHLWAARKQTRKARSHFDWEWSLTTHKTHVLTSFTCP